MNLRSLVKVGKSLDHTSDCQLVAIILPHDDNTFQGDIVLFSPTAVTTGVSDISTIGYFVERKMASVQSLQLWPKYGETGSTAHCATGSTNCTRRKLIREPTIIGNDVIIIIVVAAAAAGAGAAR